MRGAKQLLLLGVFVLLAKAQQKPTVSPQPKYSQPIFTGDLVYLHCNGGGSDIKWYFNDQPKHTGNILTIAVAKPEDTGSYQCESGGQKSDSYALNVSEYAPRASLTIKTGHPVMRIGDQVILQLNNEDGLQGWTCYAHEGTRTRYKRLEVKRDIVSVDLPTKNLMIPETIFWCASESERTNQILIRTSEKHVSLEMYPLPAVTGDSLTLRCLVWGTNEISRSVFYKDNEILHISESPVYRISNVTESAEGKYKCDATYRYKALSTGRPYHVASDNQDLFVQVGHLRPLLSGKNSGLSCSCQSCRSVAAYRWYRKNDVGLPEILKDHRDAFMMPKDPGTYVCKALWKNGSTFFSNSHTYDPPIMATAIIVLIVLMFLSIVILGIAAFLYVRCKKRNETGPVYEDVALKSREKGDRNYEELQRQGQKEAEYDLLNPDMQRKGRKEGEYERLNKEEMKEGVYHTVGMEGAQGQAGPYEALKKEGTEAAVYHTLGKEGTSGSTGNYEALKKEGTEAAVYHTLGKEEAEGGAGPYEALKKEEIKAEVYHTLEMKGTGGGEGGQEKV